MAPDTSKSSLLRKAFKVLSIFSIFTGSLDVSLGTGITLCLGHVPTGSPAITFLDSQIRFLGAFWAGSGAMLWWISNDLQARRVPFAILGMTAFVAGIGRLISGWHYGFSATWVPVAMVVELVGPVAVYMLG